MVFNNKLIILTDHPTIKSVVTFSMQNSKNAPNIDPEQKKGEK